MLVSTKLHTIFLLCGPHASGKSYFANNVLGKLLTEQGFPPHIISSDQARLGILGLEESQIDKLSPRMLQVSQSAFNVMYCAIENSMAWPVNIPFLVSDTTGLSDDHRNKIIALAAKHHYNVELVLFDYAHKNEYLKHLKEGEYSYSLMMKQLRRFREKVLPTVKRNKYANVIKLKKKDFSDFTLTIEDRDIYLRCRRPDLKDYFVVGDVQGCYTEMLELLEKFPGKLPVFAGDLIDKGPNVKEVIEWVDSNPCIVVMGNHENFVYKYLKGIITEEDPVVLSYFDSIDLFKNDDILREKFFRVVENAVPFLWTTEAIITHAPSFNSIFGKLDQECVRRQRVYRYTRREEGESLESYEEKLRDEFNWIKEDATNNFPFHIFGHVSLSRVFKYKNYIGIDTACVNGGELTGVDVSAAWPFFHSVQAKQSYLPAEVPRLYLEKSEMVAQFADLSFKEKARINWIARNKVNFISGTMSPSDKSDTSLECLETAFSYYRSKGIETLCIQPKFMGSRCNVYLFKDITKCYAVSRNGFLINKLDLTPVFAKLQEQFSLEDGEMLLLDGELMPWRALGGGLIDETFNPIAHAVDSELQALQVYGFKAQLDKVAAFPWPKNVTKEEFVKTHTQRQYQTYQAYTQSQDVIWESAGVLKHQLSLFGSESELEFLPFAKLKKVNADGSEELFFNASNYEMFSSISRFKCLRTSDIEEAREYVRTYIEPMVLEGCVVKPDLVYTKGIAPYLKVRNPDYLTLVYGHDYLCSKKFEKLMRQKNISKKIAISIAEYELGMKMLLTQYNSISLENLDFLNLCIKMVLEQQKEVVLDPRL